MFFKSKDKKRLLDGSIRIVNKFCWLPTWCGDGYAWLQHVTLEQRLHNMYYEASEWEQWDTIRRINK
ncbi:MAG: hypothetical protein COA78_21225 [Blastopirellula sp.]|nr:MAG: hypothetical protein COA78_21225 [Blastopirellula sp.]